MRNAAGKLIAISLAAIALFILPGCVWIGEGLSALTPDSGETDAPAEDYSHARETEGAAPVADNPVFAFLTGFSVCFQHASSGLHEAVFDSGDASVSRLYTELKRDEAATALIRATVGLLAEGDERGSLSGTFSGAYAGAGEIKLRSAFSYRFDSGDEITGTLAEGKSLHASLTKGNDLIEITIVHSGADYTLTVIRGGEAGLLELSRSALKYARVPESGVSGSEDGIPDGVPTLEYSEGALKLPE